MSMKNHGVNEAFLKGMYMFVQQEGMNSTRGERFGIGALKNEQNYL